MSERSAYEIRRNLPSTKTLMRKRFVIGSLVLGGVIVVSVALVLTYRGEIKRSRYRTFAQAAAAGAVQRGWIPEFIPQSAREIEEAHDLDTNYQWISFEAPPADLRRALLPLQQISLYEARAMGFRNSWFAPHHPFELAGC